MKTVQESSDSDLSAKRTAEYKRERRLRLIFNITGYSVVGLITIFLVMLFAGDRFNGILGWFGMSGFENEKTGAYVDCSKSQNYSSPYCNKKDKAAEREFRSVGKGKAVPFGLND